MLIRADARALPLRDRCVSCVVTSPPYFGLRDYGTATWAGGDPACAHTGIARRCDAPGRTDKQSTQKGSSSDRVSRDCLLCGAVRVDAQLGLEATPAAYVDALVAVFREVWRVLRDDGTCWLNLGDSYASGEVGRHDALGAVSGHAGITYKSLGESQRGKRQQRNVSTGVKSKDLLGTPWRVALALQADGWYLRSDIIWSKPNPMPESVTDRPTKAHEYLFLLAKSERYYYDADAIKEPHAMTSYSARSDAAGTTLRGQGIAGPKGQEHRERNDSGATARGCSYPDGGRNKRSVWTIATMPYTGAHFATMPESLVEPCILAGSRLGALVCDPFVGSGTVVAVAQRLGRLGVGVDLTYQQLASRRTAQRGLMFTEAGGRP